MLKKTDDLRARKMLDDREKSTQLAWDWLEKRNNKKSYENLEKKDKWEKTDIDWPERITQTDRRIEMKKKKKILDMVPS